MIKAVSQVLFNHENRAPAISFMAISMAFGAWITRLPEIKSDLNLSEGQLGTALFFIPLGAVTLLPFYTKIIRRFGERLATSVALSAFLLVIIWAGQVVSWFELMAVLYLMGMTMGMTDVAMNAAASEVEKQHDRVIMSVCHGFFSIGGMIGALLGSIFIALDQTILIQSICISLVLLFLVLVHHRFLISSEKVGVTSGFQWPKREVLLLSFIGLCVMMVEGGIVDWSTIYLKESLKVSAQYAGLGFAGFSLFMALGRFSGDQWLLKFGRKRLMLVGLTLGLTGLTLTFIPSSISAILGFSVAGLGLSVIVPTLFSASAKVPGVTAAQGIASVASAGYIGLLVGPVAIGFIAEEFGLVNGFVFLLMLTLIGLFFSTKVK